MAALSVLLLHFGERSLPWLAPHAPLAVDFFFMLSGFVIASAYEQRLRSGMSVTRFMQLRLIRLYPLIALGALLGVIGYFKVYHGIMMAAALVSGLLLLPTPLSPPGQGRMAIAINPPSWSLAWELLVNLAYALVAPRLSNRVLNLAVAGFAVVLIATSFASHGLAVGPRWPTFVAGIPRVGFSFFMGVSLFRMWKAGRTKGFRAPLIVPVVTLAAVFAVPGDLPFNWLYDVLVVTLLFPMLVLLAANAVPVATRRLCQFAGDLSYPAYILQGGFIPHIASLPGHLHARGAGAVVVIGAALAGYLLFCWFVMRFFDTPVRAFISAGLRGRQPAIAPRPAESGTGQ